MTPKTLEELALLVSGHEDRIAETERQLVRLQKAFLRDRKMRDGAPPFHATPAIRPILPSPRKTSASDPPPEPRAESIAVPPPLPPRPVERALSPEHVPPAMPTPKAAVRHAEFLEEDDFLGKPTAPPELSAPSEEREPESIETMLARWLPVAGGILVTAGAAIYATVVDSPVMKIAIGYVLCAIVGAAGLFALKRARMVGRAMVAVALSLAYFVSFASHYVPPARIFPALVSILLMVGSAGGLFGLAERWKSQLVAGLGLALGILAALISASTSQGFALVSLSILAAGSGWLLVRHEWKTLTAMSLCGTYLGTALLWFILPVDAGSGGTLVHTFALAFYHATFMAAFWKWGRVWSARERALETAAKTEAIPAMEIAPSVYASAGTTLNSLFLSALSVWLWWRTESMWPMVHWLLFALAGLEIARLALRPLRRSASVGFHAVLAFTLVCSGAANAFSGLAEGAVMAALAAAIAVAASRMKLLRWIKPLTAVCAALSVTAVAKAGLAVATPADLFAHLLPAVFLFASCLAWEELLPRSGDTRRHLALRIAEGISGQLRGLTAAGLAIAALAEFWSPSQPVGAVAFGVLALVLCAAIPLLRANSWWLGALTATAAMLVAFSETRDEGAGIVAVHAAILLAVLWALGESARQARHVALRVFHGLLAVAGGIAVTGYVAELFMHKADWPGLWIMAGGAIAAAAGFAFLKLPHLPCIAHAATDDVTGGSPDKPAALNFVTPAFAGAAFALVVGLVVMLDVDARASLLSPAIPSTLLALGWLLLSTRRAPFGGSIAVLFAATAIFLPSVVIHGEGHIAPTVAAGCIAAGLLVFGIARREAAATLCGGGWLALLPLAVLGQALLPDARAVEGWELQGLGAALVLVAAAVAPKIAARRVPCDGLPRGCASLFGMETSAWFAVTGAALALVFLSSGDLLPGKFVTPSWGAVGAVLLALGLVANVAPLRYAALGVFAISIGRIFLHDLSGASNAVKAIAFLSVGVLLLGAGFAYVFRRKLGAKEGGGNAGDPPPT